MDDATTEAILANGNLRVLQHRQGYRFGLDTLLLATDLPELPDQAPTIVELGAAQGIAALCIARHIEAAHVVAVERQPALVELLRRNIARNQLGERVRAVDADIRRFRDTLAPHSADLVVCNPPYFRQGQRRPSANDQRAAARHELHGGLADFVDAARYVLDQRGRLKIILPPLRLADLIEAAAGSDLAFESMRFFHSRADADAYLVESVLRRGGAADLQIRPPLYIYQSADDYTDELTSRINPWFPPNQTST